MKLSPAIIILILVILSVGGYILFTHRAPTQFSCATLSNKPKIIAFGDSLVAGYGAEDQQGFIEPLSNHIGVPIEDDGVDGNTTGQALARLPAVIAQHPDIVIVLIGGNDALQQLPIAITKANLSQILSTLKANNIHIVLVGVQGGVISDPFASMFQQFADQYAAAYVPNILAGLIGNKEYMFDEVHPNAAGYDIAANKIYPALNQACQAFAKST